MPGFLSRRLGVGGWVNAWGEFRRRSFVGGYTLVTLPCTVTPYRDSVNGTVTT